MQLFDPAEALPHERGGRLWLRAFLLVAGIEVGLLLLTLPWTQFWDRGTAWLPWLSLWRSAYARGAVSGLGVVNLWMAASEITRFRF